MAEIQALVLTFLERLSHNALPKNWKRETLDACMSTADHFSLPFDLELPNYIQIGALHVLWHLFNPGKGVIGYSLQPPGIFT